MARAPSIEHQIAAVRALDLADPSSLAKLRTALKGIGLVVAVAAEKLAEALNHDLVPELVEAFERLCTDGAKRDPQCRGKIAIVRALHALDVWEDGVFVRGLTVVQREGWGTPGNPAEDSAAALRGMCGVVHAQHARRDALEVLADLLHDPERATRVQAATGLGDAGRPDAAALLRYKIVEGDAESEVLSACFESLFALTREPAIAFAVRCLGTHDETAEVAALALGGARVVEAIDPLIEWSARARGPQRYAIGYLALAMIRNDRATEHLLEIVRSEGKADAVGAAKALATFKHDHGLVEQLRDAAKAQQDALARREIAALLDG